MDLDLWVDASHSSPECTSSSGARTPNPVARVLAVTADGSVELQVLPGPIEQHRSLLPTSA